MTNTQLKLYLRRVVSQLDTIYNQIEKELPENIERFQYKKRRLKPEIKKDVNDKSTVNPFMVDKRMLDDNNYEEYIEFGDIVALNPLSKFIDELNDDIDLVNGENNDE